jgi:peptidoglycan/LPS O-acetylase OafA/YrhL
MRLTRTQSLWFDAMRGLAAVAVLVYHIRYRFFADWSEVPHSASTLFFYTLTSFGHDAVMVFFVLSGALISRSVIRAGASGRWSWLEYAAARSSRLYVVLLPGLLLTLAWDMAGLTLFPGSTPGTRPERGTISSTCGLTSEWTSSPVTHCSCRRFWCRPSGRTLRCGV